jgi:hypothetical protein
MYVKLLLMMGIYELRNLDRHRCHDMHTKFQKTGSRIQLLLMGNHIQAHKTENKMIS